MNDLTPASVLSLIGTNVELAEKVMLEQPQAECSVYHRFGPGIYIREVHVAAGTLAIGHRQKTEHMNVFLRGRVTVLNEDGTTSELKAPMMFVGKPGRKIGIVHEDMVWLNVYASTERDVEKLEDEFIDKSLGWMESAQNQANLLHVKHEEDREDYLAMLDEMGFSHETARAQSECEEDQIPFPAENYKCKVGISSIEGRGLFATAPIESGEFIAPARLNGKRTPAGRYTNHSKSPNACMMQASNGDVYLVATSAIRGCYGGQDGDEITIDYRQALRLQMEKVA